MARVELLITVDKLISDADLLSPYLSPVVGASVQVNVRGTGSPATVYSGETGGTTVSNPLVTDANGRVEGWVDEGSYALGISGSGITSYSQPYEAARGDLSIAIPGTRVNVNTMPGDRLTASSVAGSKVADNTILGKHLSEGALPLGTIIAYWVPAKPGGGYVIPDGWAICNGQTLGVGSHNFAGGGSVVVPDLRDRYPRGTDPAASFVAYSGGVHQSGVGMNGTQGANTVDLSHVHTINHSHTIPTHSHQVQDHAHGMSHTHNAFVPDHAHGLPTTKANAGTSSTVTIRINGSATAGYGGATITTDAGTKSATDGSGVLSTINQTGGTATDALAGNSGSAGSATQDMRSLSVGVLYLIKCKNTV